MLSNKFYDPVNIGHIYMKVNMANEKIIRICRKMYENFKSNNKQRKN